MAQSLKALIVEDNERDAALLVRELRRGGYELSYQRVDTAAAMVAALAADVWDMALLDYSMPHFDARAALAVVARAEIDLPCIIVSGSVGEEAAVEMMRAGAQDLVLKDNLKRLMPAIARELAAAQARSERRRHEQLRNELIVTMSHELKTPLSSIMASIGCLASGAIGDVPNSAARMLDIARSNCQRLTHIVNDILDIETIESGKVIYDQRPVEVRALVQKAIEANQSFADDHGVMVHLDDGVESGLVLADPDRLVQVFTNLLSNAVKFTARETEVLVAIADDGEMIRISVRDHGSGIPEDYKDRIFDKFVQVDATDRRRNGGTGLGLSIAKQIIARLDGEIGFDAAPDGGTIFKVGLRKMQTDQAAVAGS